MTRQRATRQSEAKHNSQSQRRIRKVRQLVCAGIQKTALMESSKTAVKDEKDSLRVELKVWERAFEKQHGHKPTPADVKANSEISAKYKLYHKSFRTKSTSSVNENVGPTKKRTEYVSPAKALKEITPQKNRQDDGLTPVKRLSLHDVEIVGPTPQLNGRMLGLFDGVQENTPISLKRKSDWPNNSAEAKRRQTPIKFTPRKPSLESLSPAEYLSSLQLQTDIRSPMQETPTKSTSTLRSRFSTPVTQSSSVSNHHNFATPAFLRPTAGPINSPQSPSLPWERLPGKIKGFSALISDFKANQQHILKQEVEIEAWVDDDEEELKITEEAAPNATERKPWIKKGAKRTKRRVKSILSAGNMTNEQCVLFHKWRFRLLMTT